MNVYSPARWLPSSYHKPILLNMRQVLRASRTFGSSPDCISAVQTLCSAASPAVEPCLCRRLRDSVDSVRLCACWPRGRIFLLGCFRPPVLVTKVAIAFQPSLNLQPWPAAPYVQQVHCGQSRVLSPASPSKPRAASLVYLLPSFSMRCACSCLCSSKTSSTDPSLYPSGM